MGIEWFRDLSIAILGFVTTAVLIFVSILIYRLYRTVKSTLSLVKATSKIAYDAVALVQQGPLITIITLIQNIQRAFKGINKILKKKVIEE